MLKYVLLTLVIAFTTQVPHVFAESSTDALLLRIDKLILEMQLIKKEVEALKGGTTPAPSVQGAATSKILTESLEYGVTNDDIGKIQKLLATDPEIYPYGVVSGFFGPKTEEAIRNLQTRHGLDPVGAIGPATTALLEGYMRMYPNENYPSNILKTKPQVLGASTSVPPTPTTPTTNTSSGSNPLLLIDVEIDWKESQVDVRYKNGDRKEFFTDSDDEDDIVDAIASRLKLSEAQIREVISFDGESNDDDDDDNDNDADEDDADEAIEDAEDAIEDAELEIDEADEDGDDVDYADDTLAEAEDALLEAEEAFDDEDYDEAVERAEEAQELADEAIDRIGEEEDEDDDDDNGSKGDSDDIENIEAEVDEDESEITVEYADDDDYVFTVEEDKIDEIIEAVAEELDIDEDDVEDLIEFDFGSIDDINVVIGESDSEVTVNYSSGVTRRFNVSETDENEIINAVAEELDEDDGDIEDMIEFE